jgi:hypothetical protein
MKTSHPILLALATAIALSLPAAADTDITLPGRWSAEKANTWHKRQPWLVGCNFTPSTAINQLEMWQADTFDPETIERELGWAAGMGHEHGARLPARPALAAGQRGVPETPRPISRHRRRARHQDDAGAVRRGLGSAPEARQAARAETAPAQFRLGPVAAHRDPPRSGKHDSLEPYFKGVIGRFKDDSRVIAWDLYNEPGNDGERGQDDHRAKGGKVPAPAEEDVHLGPGGEPSQPLTCGLWSKEWIGPKATAQNIFMRENSDVISFHSYDHLNRTAERVGSLKPFGRPILCTEYLARA